MLTFFAFLFAIALLVYVHEYGHYWVAKRCGVGVLTFSIGFGKPIYQWQRGETSWQIAMIPLGGFVRMMDESEAPVQAEAKNKAFNNKHPLQKTAVVAAGPLANLIFAVMAFALCYLVGVNTLKPEIATVQALSIAQKAGLKSGDKILSVGTKNIESWDQMQLELFAFAGEDRVELTVKNREGQVKQLSLPLGELSAEQFDQHLVGRIGISPFASLRVLAFVQNGGAAAQAGLRVGDEIVAINQLAVKDWSDVQHQVMQHGQSKLQITVKRNGQLLNLMAQPHMDVVDGKKIPRLGVSPENDVQQNQKQMMIVSLNPWAALEMGVKKTYQMSVMTLRMFGKMLTGVLSPKQVSGPIGIAQYAGQSASMGWMTYLQFLAMISISLGVLNLLPVPILDGGHLLYHSYELITGKPVSQLVTEWLQKIGLTLLLMLMALALFNDTSRLLLG